MTNKFQNKNVADCEIVPLSASEQMEEGLARKHGKKANGEIPKALQRRHEEMRIRGAMIRDQAARLIIDGKTQHEVAQVLGISQSNVSQAWKRAIIEYSGLGGLNDGDKARMRSYVRDKLERVIDTSILKVENSPAHGAILIKAAETLLKMFGLDGPQNGIGGEGREAALAGIVKRAREVSPLIQSRIDALDKSIKARESAKVVEGE